jgi:pre-rRNA-processing protein IPI3
MGDGSAVLVTASLDRSIKLWSLATGQLLRSLTLSAGVTSVTMDAGEHVLLAGCADGSLFEVSLVGAQQQVLPQGTGRSAAAAAAGSGGSVGNVIGGPGSCCYEGHTKAISSLVITPDGEQLVSGEDSVRLCAVAGYAQ